MLGLFNGEARIDDQCLPGRRGSGIIKSDDALEFLPEVIPEIRVEKQIGVINKVRKTPVEMTLDYGIEIHGKTRIELIGGSHSGEQIDIVFAALIVTVDGRVNVVAKGQVKAVQNGQRIVALFEETIFAAET